MFDSGQLVRVAGVCEEGLVHLLKCSLTNQTTAPISARSSVQFVSTATKVSLLLTIDEYAHQ